MRRVVLESPLAGDVERNVAYAKAALLDSLKRGEAPIASHLLYPQVLDDTNLIERKAGMEAGHAWIVVAEAMAVYEDHGLSPGMKRAIEIARDQGLPVEYRRILSR
jgi:hypothetical protein